ncbi:MAG: hypothetical protein Q9170_005756 [Blastenia crenularia]
MSQLRFLVVGASIAGPMTAYWLAKAGARVTVIERFPQLRASGQAIDIRTTGVTIMQKIPGMEAAVRAKRPDLDGLTAVGGRFLAVVQDPKRGNRINLMGIHPRDKRDLTRPFRDAMEQGEEALKRFISQHYKGAGWRTEEIMEAMMDSTDFYATEMVQVRVPSLHNGRFVLVGDAGHATGPTGTGTTLAMTGAYVLAGEICKHKGDLAGGLRG